MTMKMKMKMTMRLDGRPHGIEYGFDSGHRIHNQYTGYGCETIWSSYSYICTRWSQNSR
jgi:hypothetical protein